VTKPTGAPKANVEANQTIQCSEQRPLIEASSFIFDEGEIIGQE
jgi:hypothetical protein